MSNKIHSTKLLKMWIDGSCFNIRKLNQMTGLNRNNTHSTNVDSSDHNFVITKTDNIFSTNFHLPLTYYTYIHNFPKFSIKKVERDTQTTISVPQRDDDCITISGNCEADVVNARHLLHSIVGEIRSKQRALQFIAIPVNSEDVQKNFQLFKDEILNGDPIEGVEESIFQSPIKLHLTICVFALLNSLEKEEAINALNDCKTQVVEPFIAKESPFKIQISGIDCMNSNYSKVHVLYANAKIVGEDNVDLLQQLANAILDHFYKRGLVIQHTDNVRLHVTLMNSKYRASAANSPKKLKWHQKRQCFNATSIIEKYKHFFFGEKDLDCIHLSYISSKGEDGFYAPLSIITF